MSSISLRVSGKIGHYFPRIVVAALNILLGSKLYATLVFMQQKL